MNEYAQSLIDKASAKTKTIAQAAPVPAALASFPELMKISQVADYLNLSEDAVSLFRDSGDLVFINVGSPDCQRPAWRITRASLAAFEARRQTTPKK